MRAAYQCAFHDPATDLVTVDPGVRSDQQVCEVVLISSDDLAEIHGRLDALEGGIHANGFEAAGALFSMALMGGIAYAKLRGIA